MPKFPHYECAVHHFLLQAKRIAEIERLFSPTKYSQWRKFIESFQFEKIDSSTLRIKWTYPKKGTDTFSIFTFSTLSRLSVMKTMALIPARIASWT